MPSRTTSNSSRRPQACRASMFQLGMALLGLLCERAEGADSQLRALFAENQRLPTPTSRAEIQGGQKVIEQSPIITVVPEMLVDAGARPMPLIKGRTPPFDWDDPQRCNIGICPTTDPLYCTIFTFGEVNRGACCGEKLICDDRTACVAASLVPESITRRTEWQGEKAYILDRKLYCNNKKPYCFTATYRYGYKQDDLTLINCYHESLKEHITVNNPSSELYLNTDTYYTTSTSSISTKASTPSEDTSKPSDPGNTTPATNPSRSSSLSAGAVAGIVISSILILCGTALLIACLCIRQKKKNLRERAGGLAIGIPPPPGYSSPLGSPPMQTFGSPQQSPYAQSPYFAGNTYSTVQSTMTSTHANQHGRHRSSADHDHKSPLLGQNAQHPQNPYNPHLSRHPACRPGHTREYSHGSQTSETPTTALRHSIIASTGSEAGGANGFFHPEQLGAVREGEARQWEDARELPAEEAKKEEDEEGGDMGVARKGSGGSAASTRREEREREELIRRQATKRGRETYGDGSNNPYLERE